MTQRLMNDAEIRRTLDLLFDPEQVIELRVLVSKKETDAGYFTDREKLIKAALAYDGKAPQYVVANAIDPRLLARYNNRVERYASATTTDDQVIARRWLPLDFDPDRPTGIPASDAEHAEAHQRAQECRAWLASYGWPEPAYADSGNGAWLLYRLPDLENTSEWTAKIKRCLAIVSLFYQGAQASGIAVKVDQTIFNAARIVRLFGTGNLKGDGDTASGRTNRASRILEAPSPMPVLTVTAIERLLAAFPEEKPDPRRNGHALNGAPWDAACVEAFIDLHQLQVAYDSTYENGHKWVLAECPFNAAHTDKSAVITLRGGILGFRCHHNGCTGQDWKALRAYLEPEYTQRAAAAAPAYRNGTAPESEPPHPAELADEAPDLEIPAPIASGSSFPELPESAHIDEAIGADACPWLDEYISFSRRWSPRSYDDFHEATGLWLLSTVAARRVALRFGPRPRFTNLMLTLCARSTIWAKTTAAEIAEDLLRSVGLGMLLAADDASPQKFIDDMATQQLPADWAGLTEAAQNATKLRIAFTGQRGWFFEEFGQKLRSMMHENSHNADFHGHFRRLDDCKPSYTTGTIARGNRTIYRPYLALLANMTPADLAPFARRGSVLWSDGFFARYSFITPPGAAGRRRDRFPIGERIIPAALSRPLRAWHEQLGIPDVIIAEQRDDKGPTGKYTYSVEPIEPQYCTLGAGVVDAYYRYDEALIDLAAASGDTDRDGSYGRFATKALRIAMLLASLSNAGQIEITHWARAQQIAERWRASLHHLIDQLGQSEDSPDRILEDRINRLFGRHPVLTAREAGRYLHISSGEAERMLDQLVKGGALRVEPGKRTRRYRSAAATVTSVTMSHMSHPAQSCDTSDASFRPLAHVEEVSQNLSSSDRSDIVTVATLPEGCRISRSGARFLLHYPDGGATWHTSESEAISAAVEAADDRHEELMRLWLDQGNPDAADTEAELITDLERKLRARHQVDEARAAAVPAGGPPEGEIIIDSLPEGYEEL